MMMDWTAGISQKGSVQKTRALNHTESQWPAPLEDFLQIFRHAQGSGRKVDDGRVNVAIHQLQKAASESGIGDDALIAVTAHALARYPDYTTPSARNSMAFFVAILADRLESEAKKARRQH